LESIGKLSRLKSLSLDSYVATERLGRMRFSAAGIRHLSGLKELETLGLVGHEVPADALAFPKLTSLSLGSPLVDDAVAARVGKLRQLRQLVLSYCGIRDAGLKYIANLPELRRLDISSGVISDEGIKLFRAHPRLEHVSLRCADVSDQSLQYLAQIPTLTRLDLYGSGFSGVSPGSNFSIAGLQELKALPKLETLYLTNFNLAGSYGGLKVLKHLREVSFLMCNVSDSDLDALEEALPDASISSATGGGGRPPKKLREALRADETKPQP
jgi:Leucine-rich repeat (LRR) protein